MAHSLPTARRRYPDVDFATFTEPALRIGWSSIPRHVEESPLGESCNFVLARKTGRITHLCPDALEFYRVRSDIFRLRDIRGAIHPADQGFAASADVELLRLMESRAASPLDVLGLTAFRIGREGYCGHRVVLQASRPLALDVTGRIIFLRITHTDISHLTPAPAYNVSCVSPEPGDSVFGREPDDGGAAGEEPLPFSRRQLDILRLLADGRTSEEVAEILFISVDTVRTHRQHILRRSAQPNMTATVVEAVRRGWV